MGSTTRPTKRSSLCMQKSFRNARSSKAAMGQALKTGYKEVFERNEYANNLSKDDFKGLVVEITALESRSTVVQLVCQTFESLKKLADFEASPSTEIGETHTDKQTRKPGGCALPSWISCGG
jgi:hypothetical protein